MLFALLVYILFFLCLFVFFCLIIYYELMQSTTVDTCTYAQLSGQTCSPVADLRHRSSPGHHSLRSGSSSEPDSMLFRQSRSEQVPWLKTLTLQICVCYKWSLSECVCVCDPPKQHGRLPGRHRSKSATGPAVGTVQSGASGGDLAPLPPALGGRPGSADDDDGRRCRRQDPSRAPRRSSPAGPRQAGGPGLWVCHAPEDGHHRPELVPRLGGHQYGPLELHLAATPAAHLRRGQRLLAALPGQEWRVRGRGVSAERSAAAAASQRVSALAWLRQNWLVVSPWWM